MEKIYISGKISGLPYLEALLLFENAEKKLKERGHEVVNSMKLNHNHDRKWTSFMKEDIKAMIECDAIMLLDNYKESLGAMIEFKLACDLKMKILFE